MKLIEVEVDVITFRVVPTAMTLMCFWNFSITLWSSILVVLLCLVTSLICYTKISFTLLHRHQFQLQDRSQQPDQTSSLKMGRYKKAVSSAIWLQVTLVVCYLPQGVVALFVY